MYSQQYIQLEVICLWSVFYFRKRVGVNYAVSYIFCTCIYIIRKPEKDVVVASPKSLCFFILCI